MSDPTPPPDAVAAILDLLPDSPAAHLRAQRPAITDYAQGAYAALLEPPTPDGLTQEERDLVALRVAVLTPHPALADRHRARLRRLGTPESVLAAVAATPPAPGLSLRQTAILRHTDLLTANPEAAQRPDIETLTAAGLDTREIVTLSQLIAFLSFQVRVLHALRLFQDPEETTTP